MKLRKLMAGTLAAMFALTGLAACGSDKDLSQIQPPEYQKNGEFMFGAWKMPFPSVEDYQFAADMGLNHFFIDMDSWPGVLDVCEEVGIKAIVQMSTVNHELRDYTAYPSVVGLNWYDEPRASQMPLIADYANQHMENYGSELMFYVNHFPNWATEYFGGRSWQEYLDYYYDAVLSKITVGRKMFSYDIYPIGGRTTGIQSLNTVWLDGLQKFSSTAKKYGAETHVFIQTAEHFDYPVMTEAELRFQFYVYLAFGVPNFSFFTYTDMTGQGTSIAKENQSLTVHPLYYGAKNVISELKAFEDVYLNYNWQGTMAVDGADYSSISFDFKGLEEIPFIKSVEAEYDTIVGSFKSNDGRNDAVMLSNFTLPCDNFTNTVKIEFKNAKKVAVYAGGKREVYIVENGMMEYAIKPGEGAFLIPLA